MGSTTGRIGVPELTLLICRRREKPLPAARMGFSIPIPIFESIILAMASSTTVDAVILPDTSRCDAIDIKMLLCHDGKDGKALTIERRVRDVCYSQISAYRDHRGYCKS